MAKAKKQNDIKQSSEKLKVNKSGKKKKILIISICIIILVIAGILVYKLILSDDTAETKMSLKPPRLKGIDIGTLEISEDNLVSKGVKQATQKILHKKRIESDIENLLLLIDTGILNNYFEIARIKYHNNEYGSAISNFLLVEKVNKKDWKIKFNLALSYYKNGDIYNSLKYINSTLELNPNYLPVKLLKVSILLKQDKFSETVSLLENILKTSELSNITQARLLYKLCELHYQTNNIAKCRKILNQIQDMPSEVMDIKILSYLFLARILINERNDTEALKYLRIAKTYSPSDINVDEYLSLVYIKEKRYERALDILKVLEKVSDKNKNIYINLGFVYMKLGQIDNSMKVLETGIKKFPEEYLLYYYLSRIYILREKYNDAETTIKKGMIYSYNTEQLNNLELLLGDLYYRMGEYKKSKKIFQGMLEKNPDDMFLLEKLSAIFLKQNTITEAAKYLDNLIQRYPENKSIYFTKLNMYLSVNDILNAEKTTKIIKDKFADDKYINFLSGLIYFQKKDILNATMIFEDIIKSYKKTDSDNKKYIVQRAYNNLGNIKASSGEFRNAIMLYKKGIEIDKLSSISEKLYYNLGIAQLHLGNYSFAFENLNRVIQMDKSNSSAYGALGIIYWSQNKYKEAYDSLQKAIVLDSNNIVAKYNLKLVKEQMPDDN